MCQYIRHSDTSDCLHGIFCWHFAHSPKLWETYLNAENLNEVQSTFWQKLFFQSFGELAKCHQNMLYEQSDVSEYLECGHILTSICEGALGQETKTKLFWTWIEFVSLHAICRADPPCLSMASNCHLWAILVWCHQLFI